MEFIFMLTQDDKTVANAELVLEQVTSTGLRYVGFKDVGTTAERRQNLVRLAHEAGLEVMIELVALDPETESASLNSAVATGVDWILGGTQVDAGCATLSGTGIRYCPFPGIVEGHPSVLRGQPDVIAEDARRQTERAGVFGVDLLAYRHQDASPPRLVELVAARCAPAPVIVAGSISSERQVRDVAAAGAWGFTVGTAIFDGSLGSDVGVVQAVERVLAWGGGL